MVGKSIRKEKCPGRDIQSERLGLVTSAQGCCDSQSTVAGAMGRHAEKIVSRNTGRSAQANEPWRWTHTKAHFSFWHFCNYFNEERTFPEFLKDNRYQLDGHAIDRFNPVNHHCVRYRKVLKNLKSLAPESQRNRQQRISNTQNKYQIHAFGR